jgi:hypothetical protein
VPWLGRLIILGVCVYGPALPMWYLSTIAIQAPIWLLLATQGWLSAGLCLLASTWIDILNSSPNVLAHPRRDKSPNSTLPLIAVGWSVVFA